MENQKQKKSVGTILLVILLLIVTIASLVLATYAWAKYSSVTEKTADAQVAKWNVDVDFNHENYKTQTFSNVLKEKLAPGTSGKFKITINPNDTEVNFNYEIVLEKVTALEGGSVPKHLHFYTEESHSANSLIGGITGTGDNEQANGSNADSKLKGTVEVIDSSTKEKKESVQPVEVYIYWEWPYENPTSPDEDDADGDGVSDYDKQDTDDGEKASQIQVTYKVITTQVKPSAN